MEFGRFSDDGREFVITDVRTPSPWINYLENGRYFATISGERRRHLLRPEPAPRPDHALPHQRRPARPAGEVHLRQGPGHGRGLEPDLAAGRARAGGGLPGRPRLRLHPGRGRGRGHRLVGRVLRPGRRRPRDLEGDPAQPVGAAAAAGGRRLRRVRPRPRPGRPHQPVRRPALQPGPFRDGPRRALRHQDLLGDRDARHPAPGEQGVGPLGLSSRSTGPSRPTRPCASGSSGRSASESNPIGARDAASAPRTWTAATPSAALQVDLEIGAGRVGRRHLLARGHRQAGIRADEGARSWGSSGTRRRSTRRSTASGRRGTASSAIPGPRRLTPRPTSS